MVPKQIISVFNGTGLTHSEFLNRFCGAYSDSEVHREVERAGRNGVGTKTYTSIADRVVMTTTTARPTEGLDPHRDELLSALSAGSQCRVMAKPTLSGVLTNLGYILEAPFPVLWAPAEAMEMGTRVELADIREGTEIPFEVLLERLSYAREWLQNSAHSFTLQLIGSVPQGLGNHRRTLVRPWAPPMKNWLLEPRVAPTGP